MMDKYDIIEQNELIDKVVQQCSQTRLSIMEAMALKLSEDFYCKISDLILIEDHSDPLMIKWYFKVNKEIL